MLKTPVAFFIFNRPELARRVFAEIAKAKPARLFVIADGPREDHPDDEGKCAAARAIVEGVNWDCEVLTNYSNYNLGCGRRLATGLDWVFENVEEAIILEDDCLPHPSFFLFCEELLERYRTDERVVMISGDNFQFGRRPSAYSYYFARYIHAWGWASWRRVWRHFDFEMKRWPELRETNWLEDILGDSGAARYWEEILDMTYHGRNDTWDYQWVFACWQQNGLSIAPNTNLVSNIGFDASATHTLDSHSKLANLPGGDMHFPLQHPPAVLRNAEADQFDFQHTCTSDRARRKLSQRIRSKLASLRERG
jgi:hypothetical protein